MSGRVLIVDDVVTAGPAVPAALRRQGFLVSMCAESRDLVRVLGEVEPQIVIVGSDARACAERVRTIRRHSRAAILLVVERGVTQAEVRGADECLRRPFAMVDLIARVRTLARRKGPRNDPREVALGDYNISGEGEVRVRGREVSLTRTERRVLAFLAAHTGTTVGKRELLAAVWGSGAGDPNVVEVNISTLRRKLERHGPRIVHTVRGLGYRLGEETG
ncbi:response regulator transcription factor [Granulicoccus sp. GXG6511]|uniref:response regulator transcription factor n=1 Tax=Granulicoccus sp. GXG6511 TaxID=3381351 RepID=UPI003D7EF453